MTKIYKFVLIVFFVCLVCPFAASAASVKTLSGVVTKINGSQIIFKTTSAASYSADSGSAQLMRKNGAVMQLAEFVVGDKVQVVGSLWQDNSISASSIKDLSLYAHTGTFTGKITSINPQDSSFIMESKNYGSQTIHNNNFTSYTKNSSTATFKDLELGMTATVKGQWDRTNANIVAASVAGVFRLIDIYFTGSVSMTNGSSITVIGNGNVIYGVDISKAAIKSKNSKDMITSEIKAGDDLRVWGKHISGSVQIVGTEIKDSSVTK